MITMNKIIAFLPFVFFNEDDTYPFILCFALTFDFIIYNTYFLNTIFFTVLYLLNKEFKTKHNLFLYLFRNVLNLTIGLLFYSLINSIILPIENFIWTYLINILISTIIFLFHKKTLVIK